MKQAHSLKNAGSQRPVGKGSYRTNEGRWAALQERDPCADGQFVYAVLTTGIFCRPTCPSRLALRENVDFYDTAAQALSAGFRACKRCQPTGISQKERYAAAAAKACRLIESSESAVDGKKLAEAVGLSRFHFLRVFKIIVGVTPQEYALACRTRRVQAELRKAGSVTNAIYSAGFNSNSRFYERAPERLGMTPQQFRKGGNGVLIQYTITSSPLGLVLIAGTARGICKISLGDERTALERELRKCFEGAVIEEGNPTFRAWVKAVVRHLSNLEEQANIPLDIRGTAFQERVWQALREILPGQTATYTEIASRIGQPSAVRAVAGACAANPVAVVIPCHRVVRTDGSLSGYRWGVERKRALLKREKDGAKSCP